MFSIFQKAHLTLEEKQHIVLQIRRAEKQTSGEIRLYIEAKCKNKSALERAAIIFSELKMEETTQRNSVLLYVALKDKKCAIYADKGAFHSLQEEGFWQREIDLLVQHFQKEQYAKGIIRCVKDIGEVLSQYYPHEGEKKNELPDDIVFGDM